MVGAALRFANFEDFGSTTNFKLATNYRGERERERARQF